MNFDNKDNCYYGHGTAGDSSVIDSIFDNGLRCSHDQLYYTTCVFGRGSETLFDENKESMENWPHMAAEKIIVASVPIKYYILESNGNFSYGKKEAAYYNFISEEEAEEEGLSMGYYLKPEFVLGCYNVLDGTFKKNHKYYENLNPEQQKVIFDEVLKNYLSIIDEAYGIDNYKDILQAIGWEFPEIEPEIKSEKTR